MNIKTLSNTELIGRLGKLVQTERKITHLVLECIAEIDTRKIYLERAYPSLYEFLVKEFGYSPSAAIRRIESARLLREIPELCEKIEGGSLNLSQLSKVQQAVRTVQKIESRKVDLNEKRDLLQKIENTTQDQTELILSQELSLPIAAPDRERIHRDESVTLTITFSKAQIALLEEAQDQISHSVPSGKWSDVMTYLAQKEIARRTQIKRQTKSSLAKPFLKEITSNIKSKEITSDPGIETLKSTNAAIVEQGEIFLKADITLKSLDSSPLKSMFPKSASSSFGRKAIRPSLRKQIFAKDKGCQYQDPVTKKVCGSTKFLEIDHIHPIWAGGNNNPENLRVLCSRHNIFKYAKESGLHPLRR